VTSLRVYLLVVCLAGGCVIGCGRSGPKTYRVRGTVTFNGSPVPAGRIDFMPDARRGNSAMAGFAKIVGGAYDTAAGGIGSAGGPMTVLVSGYEPVAGQAERSRALFLDHVTDADLPTADSSFNVEVPASAAAKSQPSVAPP
jgi:hypothetical protein